jgi:hypothetical protein
MVWDDGEGNLGRLVVDKAVPGFFGGHKTVPGGAQPSAPVEILSQDGGVARPSPALEVTGVLGSQQGLHFFGGRGSPERQ